MFKFIYNLVTLLLTHVIMDTHDRPPYSPHFSGKYMASYLDSIVCICVCIHVHTHTPYPLYPFVFI